MFLLPTDLTTNVSADIVAAITYYSTEVVMTHLLTAESEIETSLCARYLIRPELDKQGADRHPLLLQIGKSIATYYLYQTVETIPTKIDKAYERASKLLEMLADGRTKLPGVAPPPEPDNTTSFGPIGWGSNPRRPSRD